jgi:hypothetical protein
MSPHAECEEVESEPEPAWKKDEESFATHFGIPFPDFGELVLALHPAQQKKYEATRQVNEEAAILWAIHEGQSHGLLEVKAER